jgi:hypothetical protein
MPEEVTQDDVINFVSASILSGPEDDIWDVVFDWIAASSKLTLGGITSWMPIAFEVMKKSMREYINQSNSPLKVTIDLVNTKLATITATVNESRTKLGNWINDAYTLMLSAAYTVVPQLKVPLTALQWALQSTMSIETQKLFPWITTTSANLGTAIFGELAKGWAKQEHWWDTWGRNIGDWFGDLGSNIGGFFTDLWGRLQAGWDWVANLVTETIPGLLSSWWDGFMGKLLDFGSWVGKLFDAVGAWVTRDVPGHSPWWQGVLNEIGKFLVEFFIYTPIRIMELIGKFVWDTIMWGFRAVGDVLMAIFDQFMTEIAKAASNIGQATPESALGTHAMLQRVGSTVIAGLAAMTVAGELTVLGSKLGFGQVSAMIYDLTNYKVITGAFVTALAYAAVRQPLTYYYNEKFRPMIPDERALQRLAGEYAITKEQFVYNMGYHGYTNFWSEKLYELADRPEGYFFLRAIAGSGDWDERWMMDSLKNTGYRMPTIQKAMVAFKRMATEQVRGSMSGYAITRYKEGFSTESNFKEELRMLRYSEEEIPVFLAAGDLAYATDYLSDLKAAYTAAATKGNISLDDYRQALVGLGIVPERVAAFVLRVRATLKPKEKLTLIAPPEPVYETEAGKVQVDTIRRLRRKNLITPDQELSDLLTLGMDVGQATAIANNDNVRMAEKAAEE